MSTMTESEPVNSQKQAGHSLRIFSALAKRLRPVFACRMTPKKLALTLCLGTALGIMPLFWGTSIICFLFAHIFRLNHLALQSINYTLYPVQIALLIPFYKLGTLIFPSGAPVNENILKTLLHDPAASAEILTSILLKSLSAWMITAVPAALTVYVIFRLAQTETPDEPQKCLPKSSY
jgi:uncharacterized protein (DUF2062 family)